MLSSNHNHNPSELPFHMVKYTLRLIYFGKLSVPHQLLYVAYNINITETVHTEIIT
jgi:hypothetical protein